VDESEKNDRSFTATFSILHSLTSTQELVDTPIGKNDEPNPTTPSAEKVTEERDRERERDPAVTTTREKERRWSSSVVVTRED
jgi:hypothetical protein